MPSGPNPAIASTRTGSATTLSAPTTRNTGLRPNRNGLFGAVPPRGRVKELLEFYGLARLRTGGG